MIFSEQEQLDTYYTILERMEYNRPIGLDFGKHRRTALRFLNMLYRLDLVPHDYI